MLSLRLALCFFLLKYDLTIHLTFSYGILTKLATMPRDIIGFAPTIGFSVPYQRKMILRVSNWRCGELNCFINFKIYYIIAVFKLKIRSFLVS